MPLLNYTTKRGDIVNGKKYIDSRGWKYQVMAGICSNAYKGRYQRADRSGLDGWHGIRSLPWRKTAEEAQADLDALAEKKSWKEWR